MFLINHTQKELKKILLGDISDAQLAFIAKYNPKPKVFPYKKTAMWKSKDGNEYITLCYVRSKAEYKKRMFMFLVCPVIRADRGFYVNIPCEYGDEFIRVSPHVLSRFSSRVGINGSPQDLAVEFIRRNGLFMASKKTRVGHKEQYEIHLEDGTMFVSETHNGICIAKTFISSEMRDNEQNERDEKMAETNVTAIPRYLNGICDNKFSELYKRRNFYNNCGIKMR